MPRNVEIKARVKDLWVLRERVIALADQDPELLNQEDTFFGCPSGRLKLRQLALDRGELIFYRRADGAGPKESTYSIYLTVSPEALAGVLSAALGVVGVVRKQRMLYRTGQVRIHLDKVEGLGNFVELEVVLRPEQTVEEGVLLANALMQRLGIPPEDLVAGAYLDLLSPKPT